MMNDQIKYLYELENYISYEPTNKNKISSQQRLKLINDALEQYFKFITVEYYPIESPNLKNFSIFSLGFTILDAYLSVRKIKENELRNIGFMSISIADDIIRVYSVPGPVGVFAGKQLSIRDDIIVKLEGKLVRPSPVFFLEERTEIADNLAILSFVDPEIITHKPSLIAKAIEYLLTGNISIYSSEDISTVCYKIVRVIHECINSPFKTISDMATMILRHLKKECPVTISMVSPKLGSFKHTSAMRKFESYEKLESVGEGVTGEVFKIKRKDAFYVVKYNNESYIREIACLTLLRNSKYIVKLEGFLPSDTESGMFMFFNIGEFDLATAVEHKKLVMNTQKDILRYFIDIVKGVNYCHKHDVIHGDLKPENIVWFASNNLKLIDFSISIPLASLSGAHQTEIGTFLYKAPELFFGPFYNNKIDIWALGCILYFMIVGYPLVSEPNGFFQEGSQSGVVHLFSIVGTPTEENWPGVTSLKRWHIYSRDYNDNDLPIHKFDKNFFHKHIPWTESYVIIKKCLSLNPKTRPSAKYLINYINKFLLET